MLLALSVQDLRQACELVRRLLSPAGMSVAQQLLSLTATTQLTQLPARSPRTSLASSQQEASAFAACLRCSRHQCKTAP